MWNDDDDYGEPVMTLFDGHVALRAVVEHLRWLHKTRHTVQLDADTTVRIAPAEPYDT
jgi:hypothetical protein